jgi:protein-arginine kinase activator protein McsA
MECPLSGQPCEKSRTYHITEIDGGKIVTLDLCEDCMALYLQKPNKESVVYNLLKFLADILYKIIAYRAKVEKKNIASPEKVSEKIPEKPKDVESSSPKGVKCPQCGSTFQDIAKTMRAGCAKCYEVFELPMTQVIDTLQKSVTHTGKVPKTHPPSYKSKIQLGQFLTGKKIKLKKAIAVEDYEDAAKLRDQIDAFNQLLKDLRQAIKDKDQEKTTVAYRQILAFIDENY